jgi:hypothetical protein
MVDYLKVNAAAAGTLTAVTVTDITEFSKLALVLVTIAYNLYRIKKDTTKK